MLERVQKLSRKKQGAPPFIAASPPPPHAMLRGCGAWCACSASGFWPVPLLQARSRVPVRCICCAGMPGFCMMPGWFADQGGCALGATACRRACACAHALRVSCFGLFRSRKPDSACLCTASAVLDARFCMLPHAGLKCWPRVCSELLRVGVCARAPRMQPDASIICLPMP